MTLEYIKQAWNTFHLPWQVIKGILFLHINILSTSQKWWIACDNSKFGIPESQSSTYFISMLDIFKFPSIKIVCFVFFRYTFQGYENERKTENYNWINIINRRTLLTCNTKENGKLLIFFEVLFRRSTINWRYQNKAHDENSLLIPKMTDFIFLCSQNNIMVSIYI